jgi:hypothetical protein
MNGWREQKNADERVKAKAQEQQRRGVWERWMQNPEFGVF